MGTLRIRLRDAAKCPLDDRVDVQVRHRQTGQFTREWRDKSGKSVFKAEGLTDGQVYIVRAFPHRHRPVGQFVQVRGDTKAFLDCPIHPDRVQSVDFRDYAPLGPEFDRVMANSTAERHLGLQGEALYKALTDLPKAGLLNLFTKMSETPILGRPAWSYVNSLYRIRGDRVFADVAKEFRDEVKTEVAGGEFKNVSGSQHKAEEGYTDAGSFKSDDNYGNLQLTFFSSEAGPLTFKLDADIDDAAGIGHVFQVLRNWITDGETHPYDIHQILTYHQGTVLPYELIV